MSKIRLNFRNLPIPEKCAKVKEIVDAVTANAASFATPTPPLATVTAANGALSSAYDAAQAARQDAKTKTSDQNVKEDAIDVLVSQLTAYVESVAGENEVLIQKAGMDVRSPRTSATDNPTQPQSLAPSAGDHDGEVDLTWDKVSGAKSYVIEKSPDPPTATSWSHVGVSTKSAFTVAGLTSGTRYWFRVAAVNAVGQSGWSDPAMKIAP